MINLTGRQLHILHVTNRSNQMQPDDVAATTQSMQIITELNATRAIFSFFQDSRWIHPSCDLSQHKAASYFRDMRQNRQLLPIDGVVIVQGADMDEDQKIRVAGYEPAIGNGRAFHDLTLKLVQDAFRLGNQLDGDDDDTAESQLSHVEPCIISCNDPAFLHCLSTPGDRAARQVDAFADRDIGGTTVLRKLAKNAVIGFIERVHVGNPQLV